MPTLHLAVDASFPAFDCSQACIYLCHMDAVADAIAASESRQCLGRRWPAVPTAACSSAATTPLPLEARCWLRRRLHKRVQAAARGIVGRCLGVACSASTALTTIGLAASSGRHGRGAVVRSYLPEA